MRQPQKHHRPPSSPLRVGLDLTFLGQEAGGVGRYAIELARTLASRDDVNIEVVATRDCPSEVFKAPWARRLRWWTLPVRHTRPRVALAAEFALIPFLAAARRWDVVHGPANAVPFMLPGTASVITMHDTIWLDAPEEWGTPQAVRAMHRIAVPAARRATRVLTVSHDAARALERGLGLPPDRIDVAPHGVQPPDRAASEAGGANVRRRFGLGAGPVILCVAQLRPYKNQEALVRALARMSDSSTQLVLVGAPTEYGESLHMLARELRLTDRIVFTGWQEDAVLADLFREAQVFALTTQREGFGLPVLEAMAHGVPVVCSDLDVLREVGGDAAIFVDVEDAATLSDALDRVLRDTELREDLVSRGRLRAAAASWAATAEATVASYRRAVGRPVSSRA